MNDTIRERFDKWLDAPNDSWKDDPLTVGYIQWEAWQAAQADARALVGEMLSCIETYGAFDAVIAKAQAFMEGK